MEKHGIIMRNTLGLSEYNLDKVFDLADSLGMDAPTLIRRLIAYIDDRAAPVGRLSAFKEYLKRMDNICSDN